MTDPDIRRIGPSEQAILTVLDAVLPGSALVSMRRMTGSFTNDAHGVEAISRSGTRFRVVVRRYAPFGGDRSAKAKTEFHGLGLPHTHGLPVPEPLYLDKDGAVLGAPAIVMSFLPGRQVLEPPDPVQYARRLALMMARIHAVPFKDADRGTSSSQGSVSSMECISLRSH
ncbi:MAG: phosphotransferase [Chloroflexota bacterium]|nr:phosphotransferase [Chloroflexota bacterium]